MSTGGNAFATNNSGGGVGLYTAQPSTTANWANPNAGPGFVNALPGQQTPYSTPDWITAGLSYANQPIQNYPITNYGRWNMTPQGGNTNGYGMGASPWPSPSSLFGNVPQNGQLPALSGQPIGDPTGTFGGGSQPPTPTSSGGNFYGSVPGNQPLPPSAAGTMQMLQNKGSTGALGTRLGGLEAMQNPGQFASQFGQMSPLQQSALLSGAGGGAYNQALLNSGMNRDALNSLINSQDPLRYNAGPGSGIPTGGVGLQGGGAKAQRMMRKAGYGG